ncbi:hypothetical protein DPM13_19120 [Paracoccus mutanolyticus]|uniref:IstB-like ATP-binding domain-containing protein n=1 Tax=Paracoccus mutanolyticus TaxID=1499308 RepID=A0ABN5M8D3_9RHOB|nr:hypothetical protein DPM13_19120 [Paracoccus mutanolyticus]
MTDKADHVRYLARLVELDSERGKNHVSTWRQGPTSAASLARSPESFDFAAIPKLDKVQVLGLGRCEWIERCETIIAFGPADTGKTPVALVDRLAHHVSVLKRNGEASASSTAQPRKPRCLAGKRRPR